MHITDHELFIIQALAGVITTLPILWYVIRPISKKIYKKFKTLFSKAVKESLTGMVNEVVTATIHPYIRELIPNGGSSLNDTIKLRILPLVEEMKEELGNQGKQLAKLEGRFEQYVDDETDRPK